MSVKLILDKDIPILQAVGLPPLTGKPHDEINVTLGQHSQHGILKARPRRWLRAPSRQTEAPCLRFNSLAQCGEGLDGTITNYHLDGSTLRLGPLIGIFISKGMLKGIQRGNPSFRIWETIKANEKERTIPYYFTFDGVDFDNRSIRGYFFHYEKEQWVNSVFPFPDVLWDRGGGFTERQQPIVRKVREGLYALPIPRINPMYHFNKWELYKRLRPYPQARQYLPYTELYKSPLSLARMLRRFRDIYVKDVYGANGRSVMNIRLTRYGIFYRAFRYHEVKGRCNGIPELLKVLRSFFKPKATLILQRTVHVVKRDGRSIDFRALAQRDTDGHWNITSMPLRLGAPNCAITSTASGSQVFPFEAGVQRVLGYSPEQGALLRRRLDNCLWQIIPMVEKEYGTCGELGLDLALDQRGHIWFYECNAKPGKDTVMLTGDLKTVEQAFGRPLRYARYLAGWAGENHDRM